MSALKPRDVVVAVLAVMAAWATMQVRMSTSAEIQAEQGREITQLTAIVAQKVDKEAYQADQQHLQLQLNDISQTVHGINQFLLENKH